MVYFFGNGKAEGNAEHEGPARRQGRQPRRDDHASACPSRPASPSPPRPAPRTTTTPARSSPTGLMDEVRKNIAQGREGDSGKKFGDPDNPLLVAVRSGAAVSMPGMMNTILNLGLTDAGVEGLAKRTGNRALRLRQLPPPHRHVRRRRHGRRARALRARAVDEMKRRTRRQARHRPRRRRLKEARASAYKAVYREHVGDDFPQDPIKQLELAIEAVFKSWNGRQGDRVPPLDDISGLQGTAVNVQAMVFGNMGDDSRHRRRLHPRPEHRRERLLRRVPRSTPRARTSSPASARRKPVRRDAQVEQEGLRAAARRSGTSSRSTTRRCRTSSSPSSSGKLYMLQTRTGKRTGAGGRADRRRDGEGEADRREDGGPARRPGEPRPAPAPQLRPARRRREVAGQGHPRHARRGGRQGRVHGRRGRASASHAGEKIILVRKETEPRGRRAACTSAEGILTSTGGKASHAAVVARGWGKPCVVGAGDVQIDDEEPARSPIDGKTVGRDDFITHRRHAPAR